ncbi:MAG: hypothetical protein LBE12_01235 [Planctomycetaceae bacterium]|jgi:hypothetical protein|nr:hypothetical protein [Planctomycetaceae bacterium]
MLQKFNCIIFVLLLGVLGVFPSLGYAQGHVSRTAPNDPTIHPLTIGHSGALKGKFHFTVGSDGKMIRIDNVGDSGSSWTGSGLGTPTANFTGTPNSGSVGTFVPNFSGRVRYTPNPGISIYPPEYEWTAKANYKLNAKFNIVLDFTPGDDFAGRSKTEMGVGEIADVQVIPINPPDTTINVTSITTSGAITNGGYRITAGNTAGAGTITVKATINGSWTEYTETLNVSVLEPTSIVFEEVVKWRNHLDPTTPIPNTLRGASIICKMFVQPKNVSFKGVSFGEDFVVPTKCEGSLDTRVTPVNHSSWTDVATAGNILTGCRIGGSDVYDHAIFMCPFLGNGERIWDIPWSYKTSSMIQRKVFVQKMPQVMKNIGDKTSTISKNGIAPPPRTIP